MISELCRCKELRTAVAKRVRIASEAVIFTGGIATLYAYGTLTSTAVASAVELDTGSIVVVSCWLYAAGYAAVSCRQVSIYEDHSL